jgi:hypothetical protein
MLGNSYMPLVSAVQGACSTACGSSSCSVADLDALTVLCSGMLLKADVLAPATAGIAGDSANTHTECCRTNSTNDHHIFMYTRR